MDARSDLYFVPFHLGPSNAEKVTSTLLTPPVSPSFFDDKKQFNETKTLPETSSPLENLICLSEEELDEEASTFSRQNCCEHRYSHVILNDIMWDGYCTKRPDSAMDLEVNFSLASTPVSFSDQCVTDTIGTEDLLYLSDDDQCFRVINTANKNENKELGFSLEENNCPLFSESGKFFVFLLVLIQYSHIDKTRNKDSKI